MDPNSLNDVLAVYFSRLFPFKDLYKWLSYGNEKIFSCREFAFNFEGERFLRHQSFNHVNDLKNHIKKYRPVKIDIGAVYKISPLYHAKEKYFRPIQKELVFDIDMSDYDDVRTCCSGVNICLKCWDYMVIAVKILDAALREDFGFNNILWTFSGRRGIHCWICDHRARFLRSDGRLAVATYLQLVTGGQFKKKKVEIVNKIHHSVKRAIQIIEPVFVDTCVEKQSILGTEESVLKFLGILAEDEMRLEVKNIFDKYSTSLSRWEAFVNFFRNKIKSGSEEWCETPFLIEEIMIQYAYPRLDINVSLAMNHLLKSPFCVHPKTGKIGVPIDPKDIDNFDPYNIPTLVELLEEVDKFDQRAKKQGMTVDELKNIEDIKKTSLNKYLNVFENFINGLEKNSPKQEA